MERMTPIGYKRMNAFAGLFDGNGYTIRNFVIQNKGEPVRRGVSYRLDYEKIYEKGFV